MSATGNTWWVELCSCSINKTDNALQRDIIIRSRNHCCHGNTTMYSCFVVVVGVDVVVNNRTASSDSMKIQRLIPFALLSSYKIYCTALNSKQY
jgi:hypothetical protein